MNNVISATEIAIIIILPLIFYYQRVKLDRVPLIRNIILLYLVWFSTYALFHELSHLVGAWLTGAKVIEHQLMPQFWKGDSKTGFVRTDYDSNFQEFIVVIIPYVRDIILLVVGYIFLARTKINSPFIIGLILFILSPFYDVFNNYFAFIMGALNDFNAMRSFSGSIGANTIGVSITFFAIIINYLVLFSNKTLNDFD